MSPGPSKDIYMALDFEDNCPWDYPVHSEVAFCGKCAFQFKYDYTNNLMYGSKNLFDGINLNFSLAFKYVND